MPESEPRRTPLYERHVAAGGRMVPFAGWTLPVQYAGVIEEHRAVRSAAGLFDVSHMGEIRVAGPGAEALLQRLTPNDVAKLAPGRAHYSGLLTERGTYLDDLLVYRLAAGDPLGDFLVVVNAANRERDAARFAEFAGAAGDVEVEDVSDRIALLALQGPRAEEILTPLVSIDLSALRYYGHSRGEVGGKRGIVSRTGYTGEDGFELYLDAGDAVAVWDLLLDRGEGYGLQPAGLGARDTLRLEAAMALYGHELDEQTTPYEAGLGWVVKLDKGEFVGRDALARQKDEGVGRKLAGFEIAGRGIAREGHEVRAGGETVGRVTSGTWSPTLEKAIGMAYLPPGLAAAGSELAVDVRGRELPARAVELPFYKRPR
jgi:aminomethyltransferase